jgi:diguanylate cyclase (GGDEF)-like protein
MTKIINSKPFFYLLTAVFAVASINVHARLSFLMIVWGIFAVLVLYLLLIEQLKPPLPPFIIVAVVLTGGRSSELLPLVFLALPYIISKMDQVHYFCFSAIAFLIIFLTGNYTLPPDFRLYAIYLFTVIFVWLGQRKDLWKFIFNEKEPEIKTKRKVDENTGSIVEDPFKPLKNYLKRTNSFKGKRIDIHLIELFPGDYAIKYGDDHRFELRGLIHRVVNDRIELATKTLLAEQDDVPMMESYNFRLYYPFSMFDCGSMMMEPEYVLAVDIKLKEKDAISKQDLLDEYREIKNDVVEMIRQGEAFRQISLEKLRKESLYNGTSGIVDSFSRDSLFQATALAIFNVIPETASVLVTELKNDIHMSHAFRIRSDIERAENLKMEHIEEFARTEITESTSIHSMMINGKMDNICEIHKINKRKENPLFPTSGPLASLNRHESMSARMISFNNENKGTISIFVDSEESSQSLSTQVTSVRMICKVVSSALHNIEMYEKVEELSNVDGLTGLYNRRYFQQAIERMVMESSRTDTALSIIMLDIDHFKRINDTYGHKAGDDVIRFMSRTLKNNIRKVDVAARYGGEEFVLLLHNTNAKGAVKLAEKIRILVKDASINADGSQLNITCSFGVSSFPSIVVSSDQLVKSADDALYFSKNNGRNSVTLFSDQINQQESDDDDENDED